MLVKSTTVGLVMKLLAKIGISDKNPELAWANDAAAEPVLEGEKKNVETQIIVVTDLMSDIGIVSCRLKLVSHSLSL